MSCYRCIQHFHLLLVVGVWILNAYMLYMNGFPFIGNHKTYDHDFVFQGTWTIFQHLHLEESVRDICLDSSTCNTNEKKTRMSLTFVPIGRLGNRMFEYASLLGISRRAGRKPWLISEQYLAQCFHISSPLSLNKARKHDYHPPDLHFSPEAFTLPENISQLNSLMQSWKYFGHVEEYLRKEFRFHDKYLETADSILKDLRQKLHTRLFVSVQVRRQDFVGQYSHLINPITPEYIYRAIKTFTSVWGKNITFLVITDDLEWCQGHIDASVVGNIYFSQNHSTCEDLALLARANHSIITAGSSFGWWGAFLANGHVTYFPKWLKHGGWYNLKMEEEDYYLPHWTAVSRL